MRYANRKFGPKSQIIFVGSNKYGKFKGKTDMILI